MTHCSLAFVPTALTEFTLTCDDLLAEFIRFFRLSCCLTLSQHLTLFGPLCPHPLCILSLDEFIYSGDFMPQLCVCSDDLQIGTFPWGPNLHFQMTIVLFHFEVYRIFNVAYPQPSQSFFFFPPPNPASLPIHPLRYHYHSAPSCPSWEFQFGLFVDFLHPLIWLDTKFCFFFSSETSQHPLFPIHWPVFDPHHLYFASDHATFLHKNSSAHCLLFLG